MVVYLLLKFRILGDQAPPCLTLSLSLIGFGPQEEGGDHGEVSKPHRQHPQGPEDQPGGVHHVVMV